MPHSPTPKQLVSIFSSIHHKYIAEELYKLHFIHRGSNTHDMSKIPIFVAAHLCEFFKNDNPNFDEIIFMKIVRNGTEKPFKEIILHSDKTGE